MLLNAKELYLTPLLLVFILHSLKGQCNGLVYPVVSVEYGATSSLFNGRLITPHLIKSAIARELIMPQTSNRPVPRKVMIRRIQLKSYEITNSLSKQPYSNFRR